MGTLEQKKELQKRSNLMVGIALGGSVLVAMLFIQGAKNHIDWMSLGSFIAGFFLMIPWFWGLSEYCRSKGQESSHCLLGLVGVIGLLILLLLPDKYVITEGDSPATGASPYLRPPRSW